MHKTLTGAAAALALIAFPAATATAGAAQGHGGGPHHGAPAATDTAPVDGAPEAPAPRRCRRPQSVGFAAQGSLTSFTPESITLDVKRANPQARVYIKAAGATFTLGTARVKFAGVTDADASGTIDFADVLPTDKVMVIGKVTRPKRGSKRGCDGDATLSLRRVQVVRPDAAKDESPDGS